MLEGEDRGEGALPKARRSGYQPGQRFKEANGTCICEHVGYNEGALEVAMKYTIVMEKGRESGFIAYCPALRGCVAQGETQRTALKNLKTAARDYIECLIEDGLPVPLEVGKRFLDLEIAVK